MRQMRDGLSARGDSQQSLRSRRRSTARPATFKSRDARLPEWKGLNYTLQVAVGGLHRLRHLRRCLPGEKQIRGAPESDQYAAAAAAPRNRARELGFLPLASGAGSTADLDWQRARECRCNSRCSSSPAPAPVAAKRLTSNSSRNCSATGSSSRTRPVVRRFTAAICRPRLTPGMRTAAVRPGRIRSSKTMPSLASVSGFRSTSSRSSRANCSSGSLPQVGRRLATEILNARQRDEADIVEQRERVAELKRKLDR